MCLPWGCMVWRRWVAGQWVCPGLRCGTRGRVAVDFGGMLGLQGQEQLWSGFCLPTGCWRRAEQGCAGHFQLFSGCRFASCCLLARASILWGKCPRNALVTLFPGFLGDGVVWLRGCSQNGNFGVCSSRAGAAAQLRIQQKLQAVLITSCPSTSFNALEASWVSAC